MKNITEEEKLLLAATDSQMLSIEKKVNGNFLKQLAFIAISLVVLLADPVDLNQFLSKYSLPSQGPLLNLALLFLLTLLYGQFGYLVSNFANTRFVQKRLYKKILRNVQDSKVKEISDLAIRPMSIFEIFNSDSNYTKKYKTSFYFLTSMLLLVLTLNHFLCLTFIFELNLDIKIETLIAIFYSMILFFLYKEFVKGNSHHEFSTIFKKYYTILIILLALISSLAYSITSLTSS